MNQSCLIQPITCVNQELNTITFSLPVDKEKVIMNNTVHSKDTARIVDQLIWRMPNEKAYTKLMEMTL